MKQKKAFTLIELLLTIGIIGIIAAAVVVAINPTSMLNQANDAQRRSEKREIANAVQQYIIDNGVPPNESGISFGYRDNDIAFGYENAVDVCATNIGTCAGCVNLGILAPDYVVGIPRDPGETNHLLSGYKIYKEGSFYRVIAPRIGTKAASQVDFVYNDLVGYWAFEDGSDENACDYSRFEKDETLTNMDTSAAWSTDVPTTTYENETSLQFDGSNDYTTISTNASNHRINDELSLCVWAKFTDATGLHVLLSKGTSDGISKYNYQIRSNGQQLEYLWRSFTPIQEDNVLQTLNDVVTTGNWQHICAVHESANTPKIYIDGQEVVTSITAGSAMNTLQAWGETDNVLDIGRESARRYFQGNLDDVRIYNRTLTEDEIERIAAGNG